MPCSTKSGMLHAWAALCTLAMLFGWTAMQAQQTELSPGLARMEGVDPESHIAYTRVFLEGKLIVPAGTTELKPPPTLTGQCTQPPAGKQRFELYADLGGIGDRGFHHPWTPADGGLFPPRLETVTVTMEFLGYTKVKPVKRQWEYVPEPAGEIRYKTPSVTSANMEDAAYYLRFLVALPTLRLNVPGKGAAEFWVADWTAQIKKEPLCKASGL